MLAVVAALFMMAEWSDLFSEPLRAKRIAQFSLCVPLALMAPASLILEIHDFFTLGLLIGAAFFVVIVTRCRELAAGIFYCGLPVMALMIIRRQHEGVVFTLWALALVWITDIGAFFAGRAIGGPKLAPRISPNKTWAGLIGGVVLASLFGALMHWAYGLPMRMTLATPALAVAAQGGDLFESWLKRRAGVKDSGNIPPRPRRRDGPARRPRSRRAPCCACSSCCRISTYEDRHHPRRHRLGRHFGRSTWSNANPIASA